VKAIVQDRFGPPGVLQLADIGLPEAGAGDLLVRVHAAGLNPADWHILRGDPLVARLMGVGLTKPKARVAGAVVANAFIPQRLRPLPSRQNQQELLAVTGLIEDGKLMPVVDRNYPLADTAEGLRHVEQGHTRGKAIVTVA
jgi:NADPH:quinone reductase-like Zn-dependent oxidoreductase